MWWFGDCRQMLCYGRRIPQLEMQMRILNTSRMEVASVLHEYLYDREIAVSGVGQSTLSFCSPHPDL